MTSYTNDDLYQICLNRLRKDRRGSINPEEFESFLRYRNLDYFNKQIGPEDMSKMNHDSLLPFLITFAQVPDATSTNGVEFAYLGTEVIGLGLNLTYEVAHIVNVWAEYSVDGVSLATRIPVDLLSSAEYHDRFTNSITNGTATNPIAYRATYNYWNGAVYYNEIPVLFTQGIPPTSYGVWLDYYRYPADPYFDYYTDANGNITYLTDGRAAYTLLTGEVARDGKVAGQAVTSASEDLKWRDQDAINIIDMVVSDISIALSDPNSFEASMLERKENISS